MTSTFKPFHLRACQMLAITALSFGLMACGKGNDNQTAGQKLDGAIEQTKQAADTAGAKIEQGAEKAGAALDNAGAKIEQSADKAGEATSQALDNAGAKMEQGAEKASAATSEALNKAGNAMDDAAITAKVKAQLIGDPAISALKIDVDTKAGVVTLNGTAPNEAAKEQAAKLAAASENVSSVINNLSIKP